jgi:transcriptional repressor NrdR
MRCPRCAAPEDKVVDSRSAEDGTAIRRRRECLSCGQRFTTYERLEESPLVVVKRSGSKEPFERTKVAAGIAAAAKNRPVTDEVIDSVAADVEEALRVSGNEVSSQAIGRFVLERLRALDEVAYLRFASVYKEFSAAADFEREVSLLDKLDKQTAPKPRRPPA